MLGCSGELAKNENGCELCECEGIDFYHYFSDNFYKKTIFFELWRYPTRLIHRPSIIEDNVLSNHFVLELPVPCPMHSCTAEMLGCSGGLVKNDNGCELCECEGMVTSIFSSFKSSFKSNFKFQIQSNVASGTHAKMQTLFVCSKIWRFHGILVSVKHYCSAYSLFSNLACLDFFTIYSEL